ncbi:hypothetical protein EB796_006750 [Bugula neritina]|uniref:Uncharacterized protein n=1 Tax=Bugula neritina TaxID=10212 RepID=A0A7J7K9M3_BUGNE|nr:hypothetical protein EB796_006750 [Bugula neritina]
MSSLTSLQFRLSKIEGFTWHFRPFTLNCIFTALLEASKAKHQAMVAQAHAATKRVQDYESGGVSYAPRPPRSPPTKPATAHPHRNISRYPATLVKSHSQDDLSHDFYSNVRYDTATGKAKLMRPVP